MSLTEQSITKQKISGQSTLKQKVTGQSDIRQIISGHVAAGTVIEDTTQTFILVDEDGNEVPAVLVDEEVTLTATANDIRINTTAVTEAGVTVGEKVIPAYHTTEGMVGILPGEAFAIERMGDDCDFTKLQAIFCTDSVAAQNVCINTKVYAVNSTEVISDVTIDVNTQTINFGLVNNSTIPYILRYFTYREEI